MHSFVKKATYLIFASVLSICCASHDRGEEAYMIYFLDATQVTVADWESYIYISPKGWEWLQNTSSNLGKDTHSLDTDSPFQCHRSRNSLAPHPRSLSTCTPRLSGLSLGPSSTPVARVYHQAAVRW